MHEHSPTTCASRRSMFLMYQVTSLVWSFSIFIVVRISSLMTLCFRGVSLLSCATWNPLLSLHLLHPLSLPPAVSLSVVAQSLSPPLPQNWGLRSISRMANQMKMTVLCREPSSPPRSWLFFNGFNCSFLTDYFLTSHILKNVKENLVSDLACQSPLACAALKGLSALTDGSASRLKRLILALLWLAREQEASSGSKAGPVHPRQWHPEGL